MPNSLLKKVLISVNMALSFPVDTAVFTTGTVTAPSEMQELQKVGREGMDSSIESEKQRN